MYTHVVCCGMLGARDGLASVWPCYACIVCTSISCNLPLEGWTCESLCLHVRAVYARRVNVLRVRVVLFVYLSNLSILVVKVKLGHLTIAEERTCLDTKFLFSPTNSK